MDWTLAIAILVSLIIGVVIGFFIARKVMEKQLKENPPINEDVIRVMMSQMGQTPSQKKVTQVMKAMNRNAKDK
ncbi:MAG: YneF family protein [Bacilli bacterium]